MRTPPVCSSTPQYPSPANTTIPSSVPGGAAAPDQLLMLKMLAQQVSTAPPGPDVAMPGAPRIITTQQRLEVPTLMHTTPDIEVMKGPGAAAALSMLPSPLPLDLSGTGMQSHLAANPGLTHPHHHQQMLQFGVHQPQMQLQYPAQQHQLQYGGHLQQLQYQVLAPQQMHYAAPRQKQHMHLQYALHDQQQQRQQMQLQLMLQQQRRNQQLAQQAVLRQSEAIITPAAAAAAVPAPGSLVHLLTEQQDQHHQQPELNQHVAQQHMVLDTQAPLAAEPVPTSLLQLLTEPQEQQPPEQQQQPQPAELVQDAAAAAAAPVPATIPPASEQQPPPEQQQQQEGVVQPTLTTRQLEDQQPQHQQEQQQGPAGDTVVQPEAVMEAQTAEPIDIAAPAVPAQPEGADMANPTAPDADDVHPGSNAAAAAAAEAAAEVANPDHLGASPDGMDIDNSAEGANPTSSAGGSTDAAAVAAGGGKGSKYGAKRAAALKRQGYTNNVPGPNGNGKSNFRGVFWDRKNSRWRAQVGFNNRKIFMGYFGEPAEAARAYDKKVVQLHGALAKTNFPLEDYADNLRAFNQQQQEQQLMSQQQVIARPRRVRHRNRYGSESNSEGGDSVAEGDYMDTDMSGPGAAGLNVAQGMQGSGMAAASAAAGGVVALPTGYYGAGHMGSGGHVFMGGYPAAVSLGMSADPAAAAGVGATEGYVDPAAAQGRTAGALDRLLSGSRSAEGTDAAAATAELPADVAAAVAAAAALVGVAAGEQPDPTAAADGDAMVGMKRKRSADDTADDTVDPAAAAQAPATAAPAAAAANPASVAAAAADTAAAVGGLDHGAAGSFTEQLPAMPAAAAAAKNPSPAAADQWQQAAWMQQQGAVVQPRPSSGGRRQYSWHSADSDAAAAAALPSSRHYSNPQRQYSWHSDDLAGGTAGGRSGSPPAWLPTPPPHLTWQDHMKNLEASLNRKDADKDSQDRDLAARPDRDTNIISPSDRSAAVGAGLAPSGGYYRAGVGGKTPSRTPQAGLGGFGGSGRWHHMMADDTPSQHRRKSPWQQQQQPADTDGLSALLAVAAAAEAGDTDNPDAGADALAGLLSMAAAAGASNAAAAAKSDEVVLTKEQEQEWLALTSALTAALTGSAKAPAAGFSEGPTVTAELLAAIHFDAHKDAAAAKQQGPTATGDVGLPFEILSTVEQWMLEQPDHPAAAAASTQQQQNEASQGLKCYSLDHEVSIAEALACASEAGIAPEARQMYLLVLYHVLCKKEQQLGQKLREIAVAAGKPRQQQQQQEERGEGVAAAAAADQAAAPMDVDPAAAAAAGAAVPAAAVADPVPTMAAPGFDAPQQQQQEPFYPAGSGYTASQELPAAVPAAADPQGAVKLDPAAAAAMEIPAAALSAVAAQRQQQLHHMPLASSQLANKQFATPTAAAGGLCKPVQQPAAAVLAPWAAAADLSQETAGAAAAAAVVVPCGDGQPSHTSTATVLDLAGPVMVDAPIGIQGQIPVDPAAAAAAAGVEGHAGSPTAAGYMSRWGSGVV